MEKNYSEYRRHLNQVAGRLGAELKGPVSGFGQLHREALAEGALDSKTKELMALAISVTSRCRGCIAYHVHDALKAGATRQEVLETIGVAIFMGGGPSMVYGCEALDALEQLEAADSGKSQKKET
jgi:AhpD family alkylhydroperoxidase